ncbi:MAG: HNH endonuclease [Methylotenera sp.]|nr:HNH endonuclease [Oligoflexia bacterium]
MSHALVLNASFEPLHIVTWQRAMQLLFQGKVEVVEESDQEIRTVRFTMKVPAVLRLLTYVPLNRKKEIVRFSRTNIFVRDNQKCQYCSHKFPKTQLTLDHVIPVVQGGAKSWENIVTACKPCNQRKGGRTPAQANMTLRGKPKRPAWLPSSSLSLGVSVAPDRWKLYLKLDRGNSSKNEPELGADSAFDLADDSD